MANATVRVISKCFVKPKSTSEETKEPCYLTPWDLAMLPFSYIQRGLLFSNSNSKPPTEDDNVDDDDVDDVDDVDDPNFMETFLDRLKESLALTLDHFYPLAGRFATKKEETTTPPSYVVFVDFNNSPGAKFIHAAADMTVSDILSPVYVPSVVESSFFDRDSMINHNGDTLSLLSVQATQLVDGIFIGCSVHHGVVDGTSFWHFFNAWSEIFMADQGKNNSISSSWISRPPILKRWFPDGYGPIINLPFTHHDQLFITSTFEEAPPVAMLRERFFHFSSESIAKLKAKANAECNSDQISSFQSLTALLWRSITRARSLPHDQETHCRIIINNRTRLEPPLSENYFGNCVQAVRGVATAGELLEHDLGWGAMLLHQAVVGHTDKDVRGWLDSCFQSQYIPQFGLLLNSYNITMGSSPRFNTYGVEFGLGKALALRSGHDTKHDGVVSWYPGREGGGSIDLEVCLPPNSMTALESNHEFMEAVS